MLKGGDKWETSLCQIGDAGREEQFARHNVIFLQFGDRDASRRSVGFGWQPKGLGRIELEGERDDGGTGHERHDSEGDVGVIDVPCPVASRMDSTAEEQSVTALEKDKRAADGAYENVEDGNRASHHDSHISVGESNLDFDSSRAWADGDGDNEGAGSEMFKHAGNGRRFFCLTNHSLQIPPLFCSPETGPVSKSARLPKRVTRPVSKDLVGAMLVKRNKRDYRPISITCLS